MSNEEFNKPVAVGNNTNTSDGQKGPIEVTVTQPIVPLDAYALRAFVHYLYYGAIDWFPNKVIIYIAVHRIFVASNAISFFSKC